MSRVERHQSGGEPQRTRPMLKLGVAVIMVAAIAAGVIFYNASSDHSGPLPVHLPPVSAAYLGLYTEGLPSSYANVTAFSNATGAKPDVVMYYSGWYVPFPVTFANTAAKNGAAPLVQINPDNINIAQIAAGKYDAYLSSYAEAVRAYRHPVILSFGHEMNGNWYSWGYKHTPPATFVAAWRHIVSVFRALGASNVTWLWTVNIINDARAGKVTNPAPWWPGSSYVNWVGVDGYYLEPSWQFAPLFGPTIAAVRPLTADPILIAETGAVQFPAQPAKITNLFDGIRSYGLLGFVYFDTSNSHGQPFSISSPAAIAAFRKGASAYHRPGS